MSLTSNNLNRNSCRFGRLSGFLLVLLPFGAGCTSFTTISEFEVNNNTVTATLLRPYENGAGYINPGGDVDKPRNLAKSVTVE